MAGNRAVTRLAAAAGPRRPMRFNETEHKLSGDTAWGSSSGRPALLDEALLRDAFACHFLSDAFSASHANTPRASIKQHWNAKVPNFDKKLVRWLSKKIPAHFSLAKRGLAYGFQNLILGFFAWVPKVSGLIEQAPGQGIEAASRRPPATAISSRSSRVASSATCCGRTSG